MSSESSIWGLDLMVHSINKNIKKLRIYSDQNKQQTNEKKTSFDVSNLRISKYFA